MTAWDFVASNLAAAFLSGPWTVREMVGRAALSWGGNQRWLRSLAQRTLRSFGAEQPRPTVGTLAAFISADPGFARAWQREGSFQDPPLRRLFWVPDVMAPASGPPASWIIPALANPARLVEWLGLEPGKLDWFADCQGRNRRASLGPLHHYTYRWLVKRRRKVRLLEMPKARLKAIQRRLLHELLDPIPPHDAAHGYRPGRSVATYVASHAGRRVVLHLDLCRFFPSIPAARVHAVFRTAGYPQAVARLLTALCTNAVPEEVVRARPLRTGPERGGDDMNLLLRHLPQGAPTSPALANLCTYRLDCRLAGLSRSVGASYTRYADDLVFSGDENLERCLRRFHSGVCRIVLEEGFEVNTRKSHFMRQGVRQQVAGIVLNERPNIRREEFDRLKAILTNCGRHGPHGQNRAGHADFRAYLTGRVAYVGMINPARGQRLRELLARINWED